MYNNLEEAGRTFSLLGIVIEFELIMNLKEKFRIMLANMYANYKNSFKIWICVHVMSPNSGSLSFLASRYPYKIGKRRAFQYMCIESIVYML